MTKLCKCINYCERSGMSEDGSYGWFCPNIPKKVDDESVSICKLTLEKNRGTGKTHILEQIAKFTAALNKDYPDLDPIMEKAYKDGLKSILDDLWRDLTTNHLGEIYEK